MESPHQEAVERFDVGGFSMAYREAGAGSPVLLVHGSMSDYRVWAEQVPVLAEHYRTFAVSLRHSFPDAWDGRGDDFTVRQHAADLGAFIQGMRLGRTHVVGHSRGAAVALLLARQRPELVRTLILADAGGLEGLLPDTPEGQRMAQESAEMFARLRRDLATEDLEGAARAFAESLGGEGAWARRSAQQRQILLDNIRTGPACAERPQLTREDVQELDVPTVLVTGARSPRRYLLMLSAMQKASMDVEDLVTIPNAAHAMQRENPAAFNAAVMAFLARH